MFLRVGQRTCTSQYESLKPGQREVSEATCTYTKLMGLWAGRFSCNWESQVKFQGDAQVAGNHFQVLKCCCVGIYVELQRASSHHPQALEVGMRMWKPTSIQVQMPREASLG